MRKLWVALGIILVLGLLWGTIPAFGGWSWASDPVFLVEGEDGDEVVVNVNVTPGFAGNPKKFHAQHIKVTLNVPDDTGARVFYDADFKARIKDGYEEEGQAEVRVVVDKQWRDEYYLDEVTVTCDGKKVKPQDQAGHEWVFQFDLP
jgi:hypothetical protein